MIDLTEIISLTDFQRNAKSHLRRLRKSGRSMVLTLNGRAVAVVKDAAAYQKAVEETERERLETSISRGMESIETGGGRPFEDAYREIRARHIDSRGAARKSRRRAS